MTSFVDLVGLANKPVAPDCVKWSEDGVVAVAAAHSAVLFNPADLAGPCAFASPGSQGDISVLQASGVPAEHTAHHELAHLRCAAMVSQYPSLQAGLQARSLAWSPAGCSWAAGCLLTAITNDHRVGGTAKSNLWRAVPCSSCCPAWSRPAALGAALLAASYL